MERRVGRALDHEVEPSVSREIISSRLSSVLRHPLRPAHARAASAPAKSRESWSFHAALGETDPHPEVQRRRAGTCT